MRCRVLVVDDEQSIHFAMREYLGAQGHAVECAVTLDEAAARLAASRYDVVVVDVRLSGPNDTDGLDLLESVHREHPETRTMVLTACDAALAEEAARRGADCFVQKPQRLAAIATLLEALCTPPHHAGQ